MRERECVCGGSGALKKCFKQEAAHSGKQRRVAGGWTTAGSESGLRGAGKSAQRPLVRFHRLLSGQGN